ncbi:MAG TPA: FAD-dependent oxidoreductase [Candidatus Nitrosotalea sp.]|nr:FAD-dependent oxidoreductase [Candidatus Nitrosotalea sp.]
MQQDDVIIIGAGPYGLSAAVHLRTIKGLNVRIFGEPMSFWERNMPIGMFLRSPWSATHIANPDGSLNLEAYVASEGNHLPTPIPLDRFIEYGKWFQRKAAPNLDTRKVRVIESASNGFRVTTEDGESLNARKVIVACGIAPFAWCPPGFDKLPASLVSHSCDQRDFSRFSGKRVFVVGAGQSSLESGALLHESKADVEIIVRNPMVRWIRWRGKFLRFGPLGHIFYSPRDVGPAGVSQLVARPDCLRLLPRNIQDWLGKRSIRPAGAVWLIDRLKDVPIRTDRQVKSAVPVGNQLRVTLSDNTDHVIDHLLFATGYRINIAKYPFLSPELLRQIDTVNGYPRLQRGLESSVTGLYFLGAPAAWSFGPVARFVSGTYYCVDALTRRIAEQQ